MVAATINILSAFAFFVAFAVLRIQPLNDRVYFPKWYLKGLRSSPSRAGVFVQKFINLDYQSYVAFLNWMPAALRMPEPELIDHAGLDSAVYLRIYWTGYALVALSCRGFQLLVTLQYLYCSFIFEKACLLVTIVTNHLKMCWYLVVLMPCKLR